MSGQAVLQGTGLRSCTLSGTCLCLALLHYLQGDDFEAASGAGLDWEGQHRDQRSAV